jgi:predicted nucleotidyltransferase
MLRDREEILPLRRAKMPMHRWGTREELRRSVIAAFAAQDEIYRICLFGREAVGKHDRYSDIDMVVYSNDLATTKARYRDVFATISPVRATFTLGGTAESYSEMVMLHGYSPYHKIDFSIGDWGLWESHLSVVYDSEEKPRACRSRLWAVEIRQDVAYKLTDVLFSVARFTKCLFRRDIDMYRRWESITNVTLALLYEKHFGWQAETLKKRLNGYETQCLYEVLAPEEKEWVYRIRPLDAMLDLASSYQASIRLFVELSRLKAQHLRVVLDDDLIAYITGFMDAEIDRYRGWAAVS